MEAAALGGSHLSMWVAALMTCLGSALPFLSFSTIDVEKSSPVQQSAAAIQQDETIKRNEAIVTSALVAPVRLPPPGAVHASEKKKCAKATLTVLMSPLYVRSSIGLGLGFAISVALFPIPFS